MRSAVLVSGSGTILRAMLEAGVPVSLVLADRPCAALDIAGEAGMEALVLAREDFGPTFDRGAYTAKLVEVLEAARVELVVMAGFGTILGPAMWESYPDRVLNTHPALLPAFKGWRAVEDALAAGVRRTGCTVHLATPEVDEGPILAQESVPVLPGDTPASLHERIKIVERRLYPQIVLEALATGGRSLDEAARRSRAAAP